MKFKLFAKADMERLKYYTVRRMIKNKNKKKIKKKREKEREKFGNE